MSEWDDYPRYLNSDGVEIAPVSCPIRSYPFMCHVMLPMIVCILCLILNVEMLELSNYLLLLSTDTCTVVSIVGHVIKVESCSPSFWGIVSAVVGSPFSLCSLHCYLMLQRLFFLSATIILSLKFCILCLVRLFGPNRYHSIWTGAENELISPSIPPNVLWIGRVFSSIQTGPDASLIFMLLLETS